jgi:hypothetical protein
MATGPQNLSTLQQVCNENTAPEPGTLSLVIYRVRFFFLNPAKNKH